MGGTMAPSSRRASSAMICTLLVANLHAQGPPEILALTTSAGDFQPVFRENAIGPELMARIQATTWHAGCPVPPGDLRQLRLSFWNFGGVPSTGTLIVHKDAAADLIEIFGELFRHGFLIERMEPAENFGGSDERSMEANNTSAFNCRDITGQPGKFSNHSWGRAVDINPRTNPYVKGDQVLPPPGGQFLDRSRAYPGAILAGSFVVRRFEERGWTWGGNWKDRQDYQHFEKPAGRSESTGARARPAAASPRTVPVPPPAPSPATFRCLRRSRSCGRDGVRRVSGTRHPSADGPCSC